MQPEERITLGELISRNGKEHAARPAIQDGRRMLTYGELSEEADRYALALLSMGVNPGDRVGLWLPNSAEWVATWYGNGRLGAVTVPMDTWYKPSEAEYILKHSEAKVVIVTDRFGSSDYREMLDKIMPNLPDLKHVIVVGEAWDGTMGWKEMLIVGGFNVYPRELEEYLIAHPDIIESSVVGVPDPNLGEVATAVVKAAPGKTITAQDVVDYCYGNIASAKVPRYVFVDFETPFSGRGKVQKFKLREMLEREIALKGVGKMVPSGVGKR